MKKSHMEMPLGEVLDRFTILKLKMERIRESSIILEYETYKKAIEEYKMKGINIKQDWVDKLYEVNGKIWDLEFDIRKGKEGELGLEEVGRRAIAIRNLNSIRVNIKNKISEETGIGFKDIKKDHASS